MPVIETFSKRMKRAQKGAKPDIYQYDELSQPFRVKVIHTWKDAIGLWGYRVPNSSNQVWTWIHDTLVREMGVLQLADEQVNRKALEKEGNASPESE